MGLYFAGAPSRKNHPKLCPTVNTGCNNPSTDHKPQLNHSLHPTSPTSLNVKAPDGYTVEAAVPLDSGLITPCAICRDNLHDAAPSPCGHALCLDCLQEWEHLCQPAYTNAINPLVQPEHSPATVTSFSRRPSLGCPVCRQPLRPPAPKALAQRTSSVPSGGEDGLPSLQVRAKRRTRRSASGSVGAVKEGPPPSPSSSAITVPRPDRPWWLQPQLALQLALGAVVLRLLHLVHPQVWQRSPLLAQIMKLGR